MKNLFLFLTILSLSCMQNSKLISSKKIGLYQLGEKIPENFNKKIFDLTSDENNIIVSIIVKSKEYKTKEGFGVGSNINTIQLSYKDSKKEPLTLSKGNTPFGSLGVKVTHNDILFVDNNNDNLVDFVWIESFKKD